MKHSEKAESWLITGACLALIIRAITSDLDWQAVGLVIAAAGIWTPHAYFTKIKNENSHSISHSNKKIEALTTSLNTLALRLKEVEKLSQQTAKTQGLSQLNRKFTL